MGVESADLRDAVRAMFNEVADRPTAGYRFAVGRALAEAVGYPPALIGSLPSVATEAFTGLAYLHDLLAAKPGETILDLGCGGGLDSLLIARSGAYVVGLDAAERMVSRARQLAANAGVTTAAFRVAQAEALPIASATIDGVLLNGFFNLCPDKPSVARELHRVLKPTGRAIVAEITYDGGSSQPTLRTADDWFK